MAYAQATTVEKLQGIEGPQLGWMSISRSFFPPSLPRLPLLLLSSMHLSCSTARLKHVFCSSCAKIVSASRKGKGSPYAITERRVPELIAVFGSQPAGDVSHKSGGKLPLLSARPAVTPATLKRAATSFDAW